MVINFSLILYMPMCMQLLLNHSTSNGMVEVEGSTQQQGRSQQWGKRGSSPPYPR